MVDRDTYLQAITADGETLILDASMSAAREVPTCPGWTVEKLLRHVTGLLQWVAASVEQAPAEVSFSDLPIPPKGRDLFPLAEGALTAAIDALRGADDDVPVTSWAGPVPPMWWARRLTHELAIHRADGQLAVDGGEAPSPIDPVLAVDGIDELLDLFAPLRFGTAAATFAERPMTAHLHATDTDGEWFIRLGERLEVTREHAKGDLAIRGTASALMYVLWNRPAHQEVETFGEPELVDRLLQGVGRDVYDLRREGDVFVLHMDQGENRFNADSVGALHEHLDEVEGSTGPAALVVTGEGKFFSNGLDLDWMGSEEGRNDPTFFPDLHRVLGRLLGLEMATVAAINGHAFAAGAMFVCAHDHRIMREDRGYWCLNEVDLGLPLTPGMTALVTARLPSATAHRALTTGARFAAPDAQAAGIVDETAPEDAVLARAVEHAAELASKRAPIMATLKRSLHGPAIDLLLAGGETLP